ncbi:DUF4389 domain-containing protein [Pseudonocardia spinosispora]|uniref:DUF4389 domain-containing protein n=1 Tax=Pseudonocardia spinosispora TaxID=103441 RepID=UPI000401786F|nr:DUF4389 domain-containing protein [Pseudonocardia spinosispora]
MMIIPSSDGAGVSPARIDPELEVDFAEQQRRWTVLLRFILAIPQMIVLALVNIAALVVMVIGWFAALFTGRLPDWVAEFLSGYVAWQTRFGGYLQLLTDRYPPFAFASADYPIRIVLAPPGRLNRAAVLFRIILVFPASILSVAASYGWWVLGVIVWLIVLITGRMPATLFLALSATLRYQVRYQSYLLMLTSAYPKKLFGDVPAGSEPMTDTPVTRPLVLTKSARAVVIVVIVCGALAYLGQVAASSTYGQHTRPRHTETSGQSF